MKYLAFLTLSLTFVTGALAEDVADVGQKITWNTTSPLSNGLIPMVGMGIIVPTGDNSAIGRNVRLGLGYQWMLNAIGLVPMLHFEVAAPLANDMTTFVPEYGFVHGGVQLLARTKHGAFAYYCSAGLGLSLGTQHLLSSASGLTYQMAVGANVDVGWGILFGLGTGVHLAKFDELDASYWSTFLEFASI